MRLFIELIKAAAIPKPALDHEFGTMMIDRYGVRAIGLNLDRVSTGLLSRLHDPESQLYVPIVIAGHLRDDIRRMACTTRAAGGAYCIGRLHPTLLPPTAKCSLNSGIKYAQ